VRFRKSFKIAPGVRVNIGKKGFSSLSIGGRGRSLSVGRSGTYLNVGIPGTGLSHRERLLGGSSASSSRRSRDGLTAAERKAASVAVLATEAERDNALIEDAINQHKKVKTSQVIVNEFLNISNMPEKPFGLFVFFCLALIISFFFSVIFIVTVILLPICIAKTINYRKKLKEHCKTLKTREELFNTAKAGDTDAIEKIISIALDSLDLFFETTFSYKINEIDNSICIDVDLPEIEDMPTEISIVRKTRLEIEKKPKKLSEIRNNYAVHVHGLVLRIANIIYSLLPAIETIIVSCYTQRPDNSTGNINDDFVLSVIFTRIKFESLNIGNSDPIICIENFPYRRKLLKNGLFDTITPFISSQ
jgi:ABC-type multidrug transport system fused ATPase/permease subunit